MTPVPALALILAFAALALALPLGAVRLSSRPGPDLASVPETLRDPLRKADRHSRWIRSTAVLVAFASAAITHFMGIPATPGVFGLVGMAVLVLGERRSPVITTTTRTAALTPRRIRDYLPRRAATLIPLGLVTVLGPRDAARAGSAGVTADSLHRLLRVHRLLRATPLARGRRA